MSIRKKKKDSRFLSLTSYNDELRVQQDWHVGPETTKPQKENMKEILRDTGMGENSLDKVLKTVKAK